MSDTKNTIQEFGQELVNARHFKNVSLEQISESTKISIHYLQAMEEGEWDVLPRPYMEVFLKAYAEEVGMNVPKVMKKYREMVRRELVSDEEPATITEEEPRADYQRNFWWSAVLSKPKIWVGGGAIVIILILFWILFLSGNERQPVSSPRKTAAVKVDTTTVPQARPSAGEATTRTQAGAAVSPGQSGNLAETTRPVSEKFTLLARARERCWLQATIDQKNVRDVYLYPNDQITLHADREIHLVVGNAGGLELRLAGQVLDSLGPSNKPVTIVIGPDGIVSQRLGAWHVNYSSPMEQMPPDSTINNNP